MLKKVRLCFICVLACLLLSACGGSKDKVASDSTQNAAANSKDTENDEATLSLTEEEEDILEQMGEDVNVVTDETYAETVTELVYHVGSFSGQVYQLQGVYSVENGASYVSRTLEHDGEETFCGLPLEYLEKEIPDGSWVEVTGIVGESEIDGSEVTVLQVVAIEVLEEQGEETLPWDGAASHQH